MKSVPKLRNGHTIMYSDYDQTVVNELSVGFDFRSNLLVVDDQTDYDDDRRNNVTIAVVDRVDAQQLARRLGVPIDDLPRFIAESMSEWSKIVNASWRQVQECFDEITECFLDEGCQFRIERLYGPKCG